MTIEPIALLVTFPALAIAWARVLWLQEERGRWIAIAELWWDKYHMESCLCPAQVDGHDHESDCPRANPNPSGQLWTEASLPFNGEASGVGWAGTLGVAVYVVATFIGIAFVVAVLAAT